LKQSPAGLGSPAAPDHKKNINATLKSEKCVKRGFRLIRLPTLTDSQSRESTRFVDERQEKQMSDGCLKGIAYTILGTVFVVATYAAYSWLLMLLVGMLHLQLGMFSNTISYVDALGLGILLWLVTRALIPTVNPWPKTKKKSEDK
jgi:hypothetical protein